jgi:hypothetical protein
VPNTAHIFQFALCELWSRRYRLHLQLRIFRLQYSADRISIDIGYISTIQCALYGTHGAKHSAHPPVYAIWTVVPDIYDVITAPHIQASIFNWIYLRCYWRYADIWMRVTLQIWCHIKRTTTSLRYVNCGPDDIECNYSSVYSGYNIQLIVSPLLLDICRQLNARYTANFVPNTAHIVQFTVCELSSRTHTMHLELRILRLQYSTERICAAIRDISTVQRALCCKHRAKYSVHPPV